MSKKTPSPAYLYDVRTRTIKSDLGAVGRLVQGAGSVLEVGCGTGRVLAYLEKGSTRLLAGVERDTGKLAIARERFSPNKNIRFIQADFLEHDFGEKFDCVLFTFNVLAEFPSVEHRLAALRKAGRLLTDDGTIVLINSMHDFAGWSLGKKTSTFEIDDEDYGRWRCAIECRRDNIGQTSACTVTYESLDAAWGTVKDSYVTSLLTRNELLALFLAAGLRLLDEYGSYELAEIEPSSEVMIHVLTNK